MFKPVIAFSIFITALAVGIALEARAQDPATFALQVQAPQPGYTIGQQPQAVWSSSSTPTNYLISTTEVVPLRITGGVVGAEEVLRLSRDGRYFVRGKPASDAQAAAVLRQYLLEQYRK